MGEHPLSLKIAVLLLVFWSLNLYFIQDAGRKLNQQPRKLYHLRKPCTILTLAGHQDDAVIQAGGISIRNYALGGKNYVAYLTTPVDSTLSAARKAEAHRAWAVLEECATLKFFDFPQGSEWGKSMQKQAVDSIRTAVDCTGADLVIIPLLERGHWEHDLLNMLARKALADKQGLEVLQAAEYNPFFLITENPQKLILFLKRLAPFVPFSSRSFGLIRANQMSIALGEGELEIKKKMLREFDSQHRVIPVHQFGYPDLFETTETPPQTVIHIARKYFSPWAFFTLLLTAALVTATGALCARLAGGGMVSALSGVALAAALVISYAAAGRRFFMEEMLLVALFTAGFWTATLAGFRRAARANKKRRPLVDS